MSQRCQTGYLFGVQQFANGSTDGSYPSLGLSQVQEFLSLCKSQTHKYSSLKRANACRHINKPKCRIILPGKTMYINSAGNMSTDASNALRKLWVKLAFSSL